MKKKVKQLATASNADPTTRGANSEVSKRVDQSPREKATEGTASMLVQAVPQKAQDEEPKDDHESDDDYDQTGFLLQGFDSDTEDPAKDEGFDKDNPTATLPDYKKTQKKLRQAVQRGKETGKDEPGVVYVGRIPHGFYEEEMRQYFSQFGTISRLRLSRNRKTGHSKHFAFIEFESGDVAKVVAEAMNNYLMYGHILKCKLVQPGMLHADTFKGANRRFRVVPHNRIEKRALEAPKTGTQWALKNKREQARRERKAEQLKKMGYEVDLPRLKGPEEVLLQRRNLQQPTAE